MTHRCSTCGRYSRDRKQEALRERVHEDLRATVKGDLPIGFVFVLGLVLWGLFAAVIVALH